MAEYQFRLKRSENKVTLRHVTHEFKLQHVGRQGLSAYQVWLQEGNTGTEADFLASLVSEVSEAALALKVNISDIVDNLISVAANKPLSANQGRVLKTLIDSLNGLLESDDPDLNTLQEIVDYIKQNREDLENLSISSIAGLQAALDLKADIAYVDTLTSSKVSDAIVNGITTIAPSQNAVFDALTGKEYVHNSPELFGAVGDGIADDTNAVQQAFDSPTSDGLVYLKAESVYKISSTIEMNLSNVRGLVGSGARLLVSGDIVALSLVGNAVATAAPSSNIKAFRDSEMAPFVSDLRVSSSESAAASLVGTGVRISGAFGLKLMNIYLYDLKIGMQFSGNNRDINVSNVDVWNILDYAYYIDSTTNMHQAIFTSCIGSYARKIFYVDGATLYNCGLISCNFEIGSSPTIREHIIYVTDSSDVEDLRIIGCNIEDHWVGLFPLIDIRQGKKILISSSNISNYKSGGLAFSNTQNVIISNNTSSTITNTPSQYNTGNFIEISITDSSLNGFSITANVLQKSTGKFAVISGISDGLNASNITLSDNLVKNSGGYSPLIEISDLSISNASIIGNSLEMTTTTGSATKAPATIYLHTQYASSTISAINISNNLGDAWNRATALVSIVGFLSSQNVIVSYNNAKGYTLDNEFSLPSGTISEGNYNGITQTSSRVSKSGDTMTGRLNTVSLALPSTGTGILAYNTADQITNYERLLMSWVANVYTIRTGSGGTGMNRSLNIGSGSSVGTTYGTATPFILNATPSTTGLNPMINNTSIMAGSSSIQTAFGISSTINQSGTAGYTLFSVDGTESTTGSGTKLLADLRMGGSSKFSVSNAGLVRASSRITNVTDPSSAQDAATKNYSDKIRAYTRTVGSTTMGGDYTYTGTGDQAAVNSAIDDVTAAGGGTVIIRGNLSINASIVLKSNVKIIADGQVTITGTSTDFRLAYTILSGTTKTVYQNIHIEGIRFKSNYGNCVVINNADNVRVIDCEMSFISPTGASPIRQALYVQHCKNVLVRGNNIHDLTGNGISVTSTNYGVVDGNIVNGGTYADDCIDVDYDFSDTSTIRSNHITVTNNVVTGDGRGNGIRIENTSYFTVGNNDVSEVTTDGGSGIKIIASNVGTSLTDGVVSGNNVYNCLTDGIAVQGSTLSRVLVTGNNVYLCGQAGGTNQRAGINLNATNITCVSNTVDTCGKSGADGAGILINRRDGQFIAHNRVSNCPTGVRAWNGDSLQSYATCVVESNYYQTNTTDEALTAFTNTSRVGKSYGYSTYVGSLNQSVVSSGITTQPVTDTLMGPDTNITRKFKTKGQGRELHSPGADLTNFFGITNAAETLNLFNVDTVNNRFGLGYTEAQTNTAVTSGAVTTANTSSVQVFGSLGLTLHKLNDISLTLSAFHCLVGFSAQTAPRTITLPSATTNAGRIYGVFDLLGTSSTHSITIATTSSQLINGSTTQVITKNHGSVLVVSNGVGWTIISGNEWAPTPSTATSAGIQGQKAQDNDYMYVCIATNTWKRSPLSTW